MTVSEKRKIVYIKCKSGINLPLMRLLLKRMEVITWKQESSLSPKGDSPVNNIGDYVYLFKIISPKTYFK